MAKEHPLLLGWHGILGVLLTASLIATSGTPARSASVAAEVSVPFSVSTLAPDPARNVVYVVDATYNRLLAINTDTAAQVAETDIPDGQTGGNLAISVDDNTLYLSETTEDEVLTFSLPSLKPTGTLSLDVTISGVAAGANGRIFVSGPGNGLGTSGTIYELNPTNGTILQTVATGFYYSPLFRTNTAGTHIYAADPALSGYITVNYYDVSGTTTPPATTYQYNSENLIDFQPDEKQNVVYLANGGIYGINVLKLATDDFGTTWPFVGAYGVAVSYNASANVVFGASGDDYHGDVREFDRATGTPLADWIVATDANPIQHQGIAATANNAVVYVRSGYGATHACDLGLISPLGQAITLVPTITQTVTLAALPSGSAGGTGTVTGSSTSGLALTYRVLSGQATLTGDVVTYTGSGTVVLEASQPGNVVYQAASATETLTVARGTQTISAFGVIPDQTYGQPLQITVPTASSGLPVTVSVLTGPASISGSTVTFTGVGAVTLAADQPGDASYAPATEVTTSFVVNPGSQNIAAFAPIANLPADSAPFNVAVPAATSGLPVTLSVQSGPAQVTGDTVTLTGSTGTVVLAASQAGNADYKPAPTVTTSFLATAATKPTSPSKCPRLWVFDHSFRAYRQFCHAAENKGSRTPGPIDWQPGHDDWNWDGHSDDPW